MENYAFKSVAFGGFDKQDVIHYIEQTAKEAAAVQERLQKENEDLQTEADSLRTQVRELQTRLETETALREQAQSELEQERTARQGLEAFKPEAERLAAELERLRPEAEAYAQFRDRVGDIECDAHKRAAELESVHHRQAAPHGGAVPGPVCDADVLLRVHRLPCDGGAAES